MQELRIIKRYPNRRLYDTETSRYITLDEVKELVLQEVKFKIVDHKTNDDLTNYILLQIISDQENERLPIFTTAVLENIIRFYGNPLQKAMGQFLEKCFSLFTENKNSFKSYVTNPMDVMTELTQRNLEIWQSTFSSYFDKSSKQNAKNDDKATRKSKTPSSKGKCTKES